MRIGPVFEWYERKRDINLRKQGLDFADCAAVFAGPTLTAIDDRLDYGEIRYRTLGMLSGCLVHVVHTEEVSGVVRIISLRKATRYEETSYIKTFQN